MGKEDTALINSFMLCFISAVDSNDGLYAGDPKFVNKVAVLVGTLITQILEHLKTLTNTEEVCNGKEWGVGCYPLM